VIKGSFAKIAVIAIFAIFAAICANLPQFAVLLYKYQYKLPNLPNLHKLPQNSKIATITATAVESLYSLQDTETLLVMQTVRISICNCPPHSGHPLKRENISSN
jgi:hypothetical protein